MPLSRAEYMRQRHATNRARLIDELGGRCASCGSSEKLEFDHVDAEAKLFDISRSLKSCMSETFLTELAKCQLLCHECHEKKSVIDMGHRPMLERHGTITRYTHGKCRCDQCRVANRDLVRARRSRTRGGQALVMPRTGLVHGTSNAYCYYKCRCELCRKENATRARSRRTKRSTITVVEE